RVVNSKGTALPLPSSGIVLSTVLADKLRMKPGDFLDVEWLDGKRLGTTVQITGLTEDFIGVNAYMGKATMAALTGSQNLVSGAYLLTDKTSDVQLHRQLKQIPDITGVSSPQSMLAAFEEQMAR